MADTHTNSVDERLRALFDPYARTGQPGMVVGVAHKGRILVRRGLGMASLEQSTANTPWTRMNLGSTAKHMTSIAVLLLAEQGKLDIDQPVRTWIPELQPDGPQPTLRQLMNHTSGLRCYLDLSFFCDGMSMKPVGYALAVQSRQKDRNFAPGDQMLYCNGGYFLLSLVVERAGGMPFRDFLRTHLFEPLGMHDTVQVGSDMELHEGMATLHVRQPDGGWQRGIFPTKEARGDGAVITTVDDMLRWLAHLRAPGRVGRPETWAQLSQRSRLNNGLELDYGLGLVRADYRGVETIHHAGGIIGGSCQMLTVPAHELDIIIMTNGVPVDPSALANQVVDAVLGDAVLGAPRATRHAEAAQYAPLVGRRYHSPETGLLIGFGDADGKLGFSLVGNYLMPLAQADGRLHLGYAESGVGPFDVDVAPLPPGAAAPAELRVAECGQYARFTLLPDTAGPDADAGLEGDYDSPDMAARMTIARTDGALVMHVRDDYGRAQMDLTPLAPQVALWRVRSDVLPIPGALNIERDAAGRVTGLRMDGARTRHVWFRRAGRA
jgi:CubicO group peptidase (beta-lactamase class C family)